MMGYAQAARRMGATFCEGIEATGLLVRGGRVAGVHTSAGLISTRLVVNAAGFRAREVAGWAGMGLPITNYKRHIFVSGPVPAYSRSFPFTYELEVGWYIRREGPGLLIGMGNEESDAQDPQVDWSFLDQVVVHSCTALRRWLKPAYRTAGRVCARSHPTTTLSSAKRPI